MTDTNEELAVPGTTPGAVVAARAALRELVAASRGVAAIPAVEALAVLEDVESTLPPPPPPPDGPRAGEEPAPSVAEVLDLLVAAAATAPGPVEAARVAAAAAALRDEL